MGREVGSRRRFLAAARAPSASALGAARGSAGPASDVPGSARDAAGNASSTPPPSGGKVCFFTKPLPMLDVRTLARRVRALGFDGLDLTARPGGHVLPERAASDLPRAVAAAREEGVDVPMITTALTSADDPAARPILETAAGLGIACFKAGY